MSPPIVVSVVQDNPEHGRRAYDTPSVLGLVVDTLNRVESKVDTGMARIEAQLDTKADKSDLAQIHGEMKGHALRISALEEDRRVRDARADGARERDEHSIFSRKNKWALIAGAITTIATLTLALTAVLQTIH